MLITCYFILGTFLIIGPGDKMLSCLSAMCVYHGPTTLFFEICCFVICAESGQSLYEDLLNAFQY